LFMRIQKLFLFVGFVWWAPMLWGQSWTAVRSFGDPGIETCQTITSTPDGGLLFGGSFNEMLTIESETYSTFGEDDLFLVKQDQGGAVIWSRHYGSILDDRLADVAANANGHLIGAGSFWVAMDIGPFALSSSLNPKTIFLVEWDDEGVPMWAKTINGSGLKEVEDVELDAAGNIFLCGYFGDTLRIDDTDLVARGATDFFVAKFSPEGELIWANHAGQSKDTRAISVSVLSDGDVLATGYYNDTTIIANDTLTAFTFDHDVFIASLDADGTLAWGRKLGGVFDDDAIALLQDGEGHYYLVGYLVGVMSVDDNLSIQSTSIQPNTYVIKFAPNGQVLWAQTFGGSAQLQITDAVLKDDHLLLTGVFKESQSISGVQITATAGTTDGFLLSIDLDGQLEVFTDISGTGSTLPARLGVAAQGEVHVGGTFDAALTVANPSLEAAGFDAFLATYTDPILPVVEPIVPPPVVFPNPSTGTLNLPANCTAWHVRLWNDNGQLMLEQAQAQQVIVPDAFPAGRYHLQMDGCGQALRQTVIIIE
jgi:hypothetical protein